MNIVNVKRGCKPVILTQPHGGTKIPDKIHHRLSNTGRKLADTDWHINRLYDGLADDVTVVESTIHRYVIDANRDPQGLTLYPGQNTTTLCPLTDFDGIPLYKPGQEPSEDEIGHRNKTYHRPYHDALIREIKRLRQKHSMVIVFDCHSIRSKIPFLFEGILPDFNIGTYNGKSCGATIQQSIEQICAKAKDYTHISNGRFKGGWTTRHYGKPQCGVHAIQMELAQSTYIDEKAPWTYKQNKADKLRIILRSILRSFNDLAQEEF